MFQSNAFQSNAFQSNFGSTAAATDSGGLPYTYIPSDQRYKLEEQQRQLIRKEKTKLEMLQSVLDENQRKAALAAESLKIANDKKAKARLKKLEQEYLFEITRLLVVRDELMRSVKRNEELLIVMMAMKRKRLRTINWQGKHLQLIKG